MQAPWISEIGRRAFLALADENQRLPRKRYAAIVERIPVTTYVIPLYYLQGQHEVVISMRDPWPGNWSGSVLGNRKPVRIESREYRPLKTVEGWEGNLPTVSLAPVGQYEVANPRRRSWSIRKAQERKEPAPKPVKLTIAPAPTFRLEP